jgi:tRNA-dihydrouridine synthase
MNMLARDPTEKLLGVQVTGRTPESVANAVAFLDSRGFDTIDINMGCPVRKIVHSGGGSAFLKDVARIAETVRQCREKTARPLTVKCRLGFTREEINIDKVVEAAVGNGADMITIHGRTRACDYSTPVDLPLIKHGLDHARAVRRLHGAGASSPEERKPGQGAPAPYPLVTVGNGDVMDFESAERMMRETGADAVMVSRGALGNPWIFRELLTGERQRPTVEEWLDVVMRHLDYHEQYHGENVKSARRTRKHLLWYTVGFPRGNRLREKLNTVESLAIARALVRDFIAALPKGYRRYDANEPGAKSATHDPKFEMDRELDRGVGAEEIECENG